MSLAAIFVFLLVSALQLLDLYLDLARKRGSHSDEQIKLRLEIKQLLMEANQLSTPSTFAQAAKLKRLAAAKEKELAMTVLSLLPPTLSVQEQDTKAKQSLYDKYRKLLLVTKVLLCTDLCLARSVVLEYSCNYSSWTSSTALWYVNATCQSVLDCLFLSWNTPMAVFDLSSQQVAVPKIQLRASASVASSKQVSKLLYQKPEP
ncbi:hypothetical protein BAE44_0014135 [Dichanthelium oligosanthes]|uniref:Uncharacterized protein n=1 Tax=Dichanthelium oligosanthes TaxID=888268 RepID=A0A1E5VI95_9POAL|nr:hypothetical protein BAE44_0014135 [Dichanthelium oligosanthes]